MREQNLQQIHIATVTEVVGGGVKLHFRGELAPRTKVYSVIGAMPSVDDRVAVAAIGGTYVVLGGGQGGFNPDDYLPKSGGTITGPITTPNNAVGINVGDDARIADRNAANTMFLEGQQNTDRGYINFGQTSGNALGAINGGNLTWRGNQVWDAAALPYETGTWTPTLYGATTAGSPTYGTRSGSYQRIGNMCLITGAVSISAKGGMAGALRIGGLPYVHAPGFASCLAVGAAGGYSTNKMSLHIDGNTNYASLQAHNGTITAADIPEGFALWAFSGVYRII